MSQPQGCAGATVFAVNVHLIRGSLAVVLMTIALDRGKLLFTAPRSECREQPVERFDNNGHHVGSQRLGERIVFLASR